MQSVYDKDFWKISSIFAMTLIMGFILVSYSYSYSFEDDIHQQTITTIYNSGRNSCQVTKEQSNIECYFTVMGTNNTNKELRYEIWLSGNTGNELLDQEVEFSLEKLDGSYNIDSLVLSNSFNKENMGTIIIPSAQVNFFDQYVIKMRVLNRDIDNGLLNLETDFIYKVNIDILKHEK